MKDEKLKMYLPKEEEELSINILKGAGFKPRKVGDEIETDSELWAFELMSEDEQVRRITSNPLNNEVLGLIGDFTYKNAPWILPKGSELECIGALEYLPPTGPKELVVIVAEEEFGNVGNVKQLLKVIYTKWKDVGEEVGCPFTVASDFPVLTKSCFEDKFGVDRMIAYQPLESVESLLKAGKYPIADFFVAGVKRPFNAKGGGCKELGTLSQEKTWYFVAASPKKYRYSTKIESLVKRLEKVSLMPPKRGFDRATSTYFS